jgi:RNA polymerase sigma factor (sigma-70 family)
MRTSTTRHLCSPRLCRGFFMRYRCSTSTHQRLQPFVGPTAAPPRVCPFADSQLQCQMMGDDSISIWIKQLKAGEAEAAQRLWERYCHRLIGLARKKLQDSPRQVKDEEDVVQSAFMSFCARAQAGLFPDLRDRDNLWPLLALITARKATNQRLHERRAKRGGGRVAATAEALEFAEVIADEPSPEEAAIFFSELERILELLDPTCGRILLWKLEERTNAEIAQQLDCSERSVERKLRLIRCELGDELSSP